MVVRFDLSGGFFDIVGFMMKGHVGDGAWSGGFKAPDTSNKPIAAFIRVTTILM